VCAGNHPGPARQSHSHFLDADSPRGELVGSFDGTVTSGRPGDRSSSRVGVCRLRRWRCVLQPTAASPRRRLLHRAFPEFGVRLTGRHEPGDQYHSERSEWLHRFRSDRTQHASRRGDFESFKPIRRGGRSDRPHPHRRGSQRSDGEFHDFRGGNQRRIVAWRESDGYNPERGRRCAPAHGVRENGFDFGGR